MDENIMRFHEKNKYIETFSHKSQEPFFEFNKALRKKNEINGFFFHH